MRKQITPESIIVSEETTQCKYCGKYTEGSAKKCKHCGRKLPDYEKYIEELQINDSEELLNLHARKKKK